MRSKPFSTWVTLSWLVVVGCGGKTSEPLPSDAQPEDMTPVEAAVAGGVVDVPPASPAMASSGAQKPDAGPEAELAAEADGSAGRAAESPPKPDQAPSFCGGRATSLVGVTANLDASAYAINTAAVVGPPAIAANPFDVQNPANSANFSTTVIIYDALGVAHTMDIYFRKSDAAARTWDYHLLLPAADVASESLDGNFEAGAGTLRFAGNGALSSDSGSPLTIAFRNTSVSSTIKIVFARRSGRLGVAEGTTSVPGYSTVTAQFQDGHAASWGSEPCRQRGGPTR